MKASITWSVVLLALTPLLAEAGTIELHVNCNEGKSVSKALENARVSRHRDGDAARNVACIGRDPHCPPNQLIINITGTCLGPIRINRDNVTLRGSSPETAILDGSTGELAPLIYARSVRGVRFENLTIRGAFTGVALDDTSAFMDNCRIIEHEAAGIILLGSRTQLRMEHSEEGATRNAST